jgi:hypothetical protein
LAVAASMQKELFVDQEYESGTEWVIGPEDLKIEWFKNSVL